MMAMVIKMFTARTSTFFDSNIQTEIISSCAERRRKPQPRVGNWKPNSRWCIHGHQDPDFGTLTTYVPAAPGESIMMFCQVGLNMNHACAFTDVKHQINHQQQKITRTKSPVESEARSSIRHTLRGTKSSRRCSH